MNTEVNVAYRRGQFLHAAEALDRLQFLDDEHAVLKAEVAYFLGHLDEAVNLASRCLKSISAPSRRWQLLSVLASVRWDQGELAESIVLTRQAHELAIGTGEATAIARSAVPLLERTCNASAYDSALPISTVARRATHRSGDVQVLALLHLVHGRLETRCGTVAVAHRHFQRCHSLLSRDSNLWLSAAAFLDQTHVLSSQGDIISAIEAAQTGCGLAEEAGWSKGIAAGAANLSSLFLAVGNLASSQYQLESSSVSNVLQPRFPVRSL